MKRNIQRDGWASAGVRRFINLTTPYLKVVPAWMARPVPPQLGDAYRVSDFAQTEVECPVPPHDADIPNAWLHHVVRGIRINIETSVRLCEEVDDKHRLHISPIVQDDRLDISDFQRTHGLSGCVITFASLFDRLVEFDLQRAREEFLAWPSDDDTVFARLRLWASGKPALATPHALSQLVLRLGEDVFWGSYHQRDLLLVLSSRWSELSSRDRRQIEIRLLRGPGQWEEEDDDSFKDRQTWAVLERLQWLTRRGCEFSFDVRTEIATRRSAAPKWKPEYAEHAAESREMWGGHIATDTECGPLIREPITSVLSKALELSGRSETNSLSTVREITDALSAPSPCPLPRGARGHWTVISRTVLTYFGRSWQVAVSPCWKVALPDVVSAVCVKTLGPLPRRVPTILPIFVLFLTGWYTSIARHRPRLRVDKHGTPRKSLP